MNVGTQNSTKISLIVQSLLFGLVFFKKLSMFIGLKEKTLVRKIWLLLMYVLSIDVFPF